MGCVELLNYLEDGRGLQLDEESRLDFKLAQTRRRRNKRGKIRDCLVAVCFTQGAIQSADCTVQLVDDVRLHTTLIENEQSSGGLSTFRLYAMDRVAYRKFVSCRASSTLKPDRMTVRTSATV
jgi:hypothetical protein